MNEYDQDPKINDDFYGLLFISSNIRLILSDFLQKNNKYFHKFERQILFNY